MTRLSCRNCSSSFEVTDSDLKFYEEVSLMIGGRKYAIPPPTHCPDCRQQRRWAFQNQQFLYRRKSDATEKEIISAYSPEKPLAVYEREEWLKVDNTERGVPFDFNRPFFEQFGELFRKTPKASVLQSGEMLNSEYAHFAGWLKNCYLVFDTGCSEDCMYSTFFGYCKNCIDCLDMQQNELCYNCVDLSNCYRLFHSTFCRSCNFSAYLFDCIGCKHCIGCVNLRNKEYYVFNEGVGREEYERLWRELFDGTFSKKKEMKERWQEFSLRCPRRAVHNINAPDSTGDYLVHCENAKNCFKCFELKDAKYCQYIVWRSSDLQDISAYGESQSFCYEMSASGGLVGRIAQTNCCFGAYIFFGGSNIYYSIHCHESCKDLFGCCDLRGKQYCILNKQYTKGQYEELLPKIIEHMRRTGEWGEFFPIHLSPFCYNETLAQVYFPLTREEALKKGYSWKEPDRKEYQPQIYVVPDAINDVFDAVTKEILACASCGRNYKIISQELSFYREMGLPVPRLCPNCRFLERLKRRNPQKLWQRECAKCQKPIATTYAPDRPEIVYCEGCYLETVY